MRNLLRKPLPWMVVSECAIVAALAIVAWHMIASPPAPAASDTRFASPTAAAREPVAHGPTVIGKGPVPVVPLMPGLNIDPGFWKLRLAELNGGERTFEQLEWTIVHSAMDAARRYVKSVVLPALAQAERR
ncbi:MAG: hypothetical protein QOG08_1868 [Chloroflexota bacterium]|jgi:hypothetical protein|nr:hypothetical protein [Chloroflexota bacterium]